MATRGEKRKEYMRKWRAKNKERLAKYKADYDFKYYRTKKEEIIKKQKLYVAKNKEKVKARGKEYYLKTREKGLIERKKWREKNKDRAREMTKKWREKNRERVNVVVAIYNAFYRASRLKATPSWINKKEIADIYKKASQLHLEVDHIVPLKHPNICGLHVPWNLQLLTKIENARKGNKFLCA